MRTPARSDRARPSPARLVALGTTLVTGLLVVGAAPAASAASAAGTDVAALRAQADDIANQYFKALSRARDLDAEIASTQATVSELQTKAERARTDARARALVAYKSSSTSHLAALIDGHGALDAARRAHLIAKVNARDTAVYSKLHRALGDLREQRRALDDAKQAQSDVVARLDAQASAMNAKLVAAEQQERAQAALQAAPQPGAEPSTRASSPATQATGAPTTSAPPKPTTPPPPPDYHGTPGTSPHHDDPFLTCVRQRESGGNYGAVSPGGLYRGAYQFSQPTWNGAANHAGRPDLVGVAPNVATPYDQDEVAWSLYQWQGAGPWGGSCP